MADDQTGGVGAPKKSVDLAKFRELEAQGKEAQAAAQQALDSLSHSYGSVQAALEARLEPFADIRKRMSAVTDIAGAASALGGVALKIADQQRALEALHPQGDNMGAFLDRSVEDVLGIRDIAAPPALDLPKLPPLPPHPALETNKRLERIERRFEQMQDIAQNSAQITNGLHASAAEIQASVKTFLSEFKTAAKDSDASTRRATYLAVLALIVAVATPIYQAWMEKPNSDPVLQASVEQLRAELTALREQQAEASDRLTETLNAADQDTVTVLRDIRDVLSVPSSANPTEP